MATKDNKPIASTPAPTTPVEKMTTGKGRTTRLLRAGIFSLMAFVLLVVGVFIIGSKSNLFEPTLPVFTTFKTVEGLQGGAGVMLNGIKIGTVSNVQLMLDDSSYVRVDMVIDESYSGFITEATIATVGQEGLIGDKLVDLKLRAMNARQLKPGEYMESAPPPDYFAVVDEVREMVASAQSITTSLDTLLMRFRRGEGTLGKFLTDDQAYNDLVKITQTAEGLFATTAKQIEGISQTLQRSAQTVNAITIEAEKLIADVGKGKGTVGALMYDRSLYDSLEVLAGTLNEAVNNAGFAAQEFGINMRGLRNNWLVGGLFGGEEDVQNIQLQQKMLEIRMAEIARERELLEQRQKEILELQNGGQ
jgi:phospholipid/cholesterol/gamma-HCH transport system substrate-binding protein